MIGECSMNASEENCIQNFSLEAKSKCSFLSLYGEFSTNFCLN
jgi:hypothetical protein